MFCRNCGKELSDEAVMCPNCGTPIAHPAQPKKKPAAESEPTPTGELKGKTGSVIAFTCALIALVCCIFFVSYTIAGGRLDLNFHHYTGRSYDYYSLDYTNLPMIFGYAMGLLTIATSLIGLLGGIYGVIHAAGVKKYRALSITAIVLSAAALLLFFLLYCTAYIMYSNSL